MRWGFRIEVVDSVSAIIVLQLNHHCLLLGKAAPLALFIASCYKRP